MIESIWDILGIDPTTDKKKIKKAYAEKTKVYHPEDYPEEFKIVQEAYQWAMKYASKSVLDDEDLEIGINTNKSTDEVIEVNKKEENKSIEIDYSNLEEEDFKIKDNRKEKTNKKSETNSSNNKKSKDGEIFNEIYNERTRDDEVDQMRYFLDYIEKKIPKKINMEMFKLILSNSYIKSYLEHPDFKTRFEEIMVNKSYADTLYTEKKMSEIARKYNLYKVARSIDKDTKRRYIVGIRTPVFMLGIAVAVSGMFLKVESKKAEKAEQISNSINQSIEKSGETVHKIRESMLNTSLIVNKDFINGYDVTVDEEDGYYSILDKDKNTILGNVSRVEFTMSNLIIAYQAGEYSIINTSNGNIAKTKYSDIKSADIIKDNDKKYGIVGMEKDKTWYIIDENGNKIQKISGEPNIGKIKVEIKDGKTSFVSEK
ncbi:MAG: J domain-containing protein [Peptacetobacter hiranonis]|nr:J domain-containing protein [Peptacetobacter hiranonis]